MATLTTFGVAATDIAERLQNYGVGTATGPTQTQVDAIIDGQAGLWCSLLYGMGVVAPQSVTATHPVFQLSREWIILRSAAQAMRARERFNPDLANAWIEETDALWERVKAMPGLLTDLRPTGENAPNLNWSPTNALAAQARLAIASQSVAIQNGAVYKV
jgi:hypothetical protein